MIKFSIIAVCESELSPKNAIYQCVPLLGEVFNPNEMTNVLENSKAKKLIIMFKDIVLNTAVINYNNTEEYYTISVEVSNPNCELTRFVSKVAKDLQSSGNIEYSVWFQLGGFKRE